MEPIPVAERLPELTNGMSDMALAYDYSKRKWFFARYVHLGDYCYWRTVVRGCDNDEHDYIYLSVTHWLPEPDKPIS
jgi:hypothetical protein